MIFSGDLDTDIVFDYGILSQVAGEPTLPFKRLDMRIDLRMEHLSGARLFSNWDGAVARLRRAATAIR